MNCPSNMNQFESDYNNNLKLLIKTHSSGKMEKT